jgi:hypothetical protein
VAALTDGRRLGGFTLEATGAARRHANAPEVWVWCARQADQGAGASERAGHHDHQGPARQRHHRAVPPGCALRPSAVAALADGRRSGGFTLEATGDTLRAHTPGLSL